MAVIIDPKKNNTSKVNVGCNVPIHDEELDEDITYSIVGDTESDPENGLISNISPVGRALMGHAVGDVVEASVPYGTIKMKVLKIKA